MARGYSITLVVGSGFPGHASIQINGPEGTLYTGLGPRESRHIWSDGSYDTIDLPNGANPVGAVKPDNPNEEYSYVNASHYKVKSYTFEISEQRALAARKAAEEYQKENPNYNGFDRAICTDYALTILQTALPNSNLRLLSRLPSMLQRQLTEASQNNSIATSQEGYKFKTNLPAFQEDETPPKFSVPPTPLLSPPIPKIGSSDEIVRDSVRAAGVPTRNNVLEYGYPTSDLTPAAAGPSANGVPPGWYPGQGIAGQNAVGRFDNWTLPAAATAPPDWPAPTPAPAPPSSPSSQGPLTLKQAYEEYRARMNAANSQNQSVDPGAAPSPLAMPSPPTAPVALPHSAAGWFAEMTGLDPNDPTHPAAMPDEDQLQAFVGRQPIAPWTLQRR